MATATAEFANRRSNASDPDVVVSLLPYDFHPKVARLCLDAGKSMVTTSYVSDEMRAMFMNTPRVRRLMNAL